MWNVIADIFQHIVNPWKKAQPETEAFSERQISLISTQKNGKNTTTSRSDL